MNWWYSKFKCSAKQLVNNGLCIGLLSKLNDLLHFQKYFVTRKLEMSDSPILTVYEGKLKGKACVNYDGKAYYSFQGIPYAKPPLGNLRFMPPQPPEKWEGIRDATQEGLECYSKSFITSAIGGSEDCLFLNVYTPKINSNERLPVMFWIHGGGFVSGSGGTELFGPDYLVDKNVVLVTINYRLGPLGFLAFSDPSTGVTGNAGLKDIVMALKWVRRNISNFSGDPKNVTIFGESAGGAAVHFLILSPTAKGLFHKAILQSGCALNCFTRSRCSYTHQLAYKLGIDSNNDKFILSELQKISVEELFEASQKLRDTFLVSNLRPFCPVIEPKASQNAFLTEEPLEIIKSGKYNKVPIIMGYNSLEGAFVYFCTKRYTKYSLTDATLVPHTLNLRIGSESYARVAKEIRTMYGITEEVSDEKDSDLQKILKVYTHNYFMIDICRSAMLHCAHNKFPIYFYRFDLDTKLNIMKQICGVQAKGAAHADDLFYLFNSGLMSPPEKTSEEYKLIQKMTKLWTNFAKHENPTPRIDDEIGVVWNPISSHNLDYLSMENEKFRMQVNPDKNAIDFWNDLYRKYQIHLSKL